MNPIPEAMLCRVKDAEKRLNNIIAALSREDRVRIAGTLLKLQELEELYGEYPVYVAAAKYMSRKIPKGKK